MIENKEFFNYSILMVMFGALWGTGSRDLSVLYLSHEPTPLAGIVIAAVGAIAAILLYQDTKNVVSVDGGD